MTFFQLILFVLAAAIFFVFFKKLFNDDFPKRGVDFESKLDSEQIGGISSPDKIFSKPKVQISRVDSLMGMASEAIDKGDFDDASKAIQSALIIEPDNIDILHMAGFIAIERGDLQGAKDYYKTILEKNNNDDLAHASLANVLHKNSEDELAIIHHKKSIELDGEYAKHYFNYANTLYDMHRYAEALDNYKQALKIDGELGEAREMVTKLVTMDLK